MTFEDLKKYINKGIPVIILLQTWNWKTINYTNDYHDGHRVVVIWYDDNKIFFEDPYIFERTFLTKEELMTRRHSKDEWKKVYQYWIVVYGWKSVYSSKK